MTRIEALEKSLKMWKWLRDQAFKGNYYKKEDWFENIGEKRVCSSCYLCEYAKNNLDDLGKALCVKCPIEEWRDSKKILETPRCALESSPYHQWTNGMFGFGLSLEKSKYDIIQGSYKMVEFYLE